MAFQTGTKVDPRLMAVDYSPIIRANEIKAQAISNLGGQVGGAIKDYKRNKEDVKVKQGQVDQFIRLGESMADLFSESNPAMAEGLRDLIGDASNPDIPLSQRYSMTQNSLNQFNSLLEAGSQAKPDTKSLQAQQNNKFFRNAVASNTNTDGSVDWPNVTPSYVALGGTDSESVSKLASEQRAINAPHKQSAFAEIVDYFIGIGYTKKDAIEAANKRGQTINVGGDEKVSPYEKDVYSSQIAPIVKGLPGAREAVNMANLGLKLLNEGVPTGTGQDAALMAKKMANAFGADFDVSNQELFKSKIEPMLMDFIANTKGAISDKEMDVFASWSAGLSKTPEGNRKILNAMKKAANNVIEVNELLSKMPKASPMQQQEAVNKYLDDNPLVNYSNERNALVTDDGFRFELIPK
jgi:hypothetical protein